MTRTGLARKPHTSEVVLYLRGGGELVLSFDEFKVLSQQVMDILQSFLAERRQISALPADTQSEHPDG